MLKMLGKLGLGLENFFTDVFKFENLLTNFNETRKW